MWGFLDDGYPSLSYPERYLYLYLSQGEHRWLHQLVGEEHNGRSVSESELASEGAPVGTHRGTLPTKYGEFASPFCRDS